MECDSDEVEDILQSVEFDDSGVVSVGQGFVNLVGSVRVEAVSVGFQECQTERCQGCLDVCFLLLFLSANA